MDQNIDKCGWRVALARLSKSLSGKQAEIEIAALRLGWPDRWRNGCLSSVTCDPKDDIVEVVLEGLDHIVSRPRELPMNRHIVKFREPLMLSAPL